MTGTAEWAYGPNSAQVLWFLKLLSDLDDDGWERLLLAADRLRHGSAFVDMAVRQATERAGKSLGTEFDSLDERVTRAVNGALAGPAGLRAISACAVVVVVPKYGPAVDLKTPEVDAALRAGTDLVFGSVRIAAMALALSPFITRAQFNTLWGACEVLCPSDRLRADALD